MDQNHKRQRQLQEPEDSVVARHQESGHSTDDEFTSIFPSQPPFRQVGQDICQPDLESIWCEFEARRESANYYLKQYLEYLGSIDFDEPTSSREVTTRGQHTSTNMNSTQLKISADTAIRDLLIMEEIIDYVAGSASKPDVSLVTALCTFACSVSAATVPVKVVAGASVAGVFVGTLFMTVPFAWRKFQTHDIRKIKTNLQSLRQAFEQSNIGEIHQHALKSSRFMYLKWALVGL